MRADIDEDGKEIRIYETVIGARINHDMSLGLHFGAWKRFNGLLDGRASQVSCWK